MRRAPGRAPGKAVNEASLLSRFIVGLDLSQLSALSRTRVAVCERPLPQQVCGGFHLDSHPAILCRDVWARSSAQTLAPPFRRSPRYCTVIMLHLNTWHLIRRSIAFAAAVAAVAVMSASAGAHPHVWVTVKSELIFAPDGWLTGVAVHAWMFDDMVSTFAVQALKSRGSRAVHPRGSRSLAETNVYLAQGIRILYVRQSERQAGGVRRSTWQTTI